MISLLFFLGTAFLLTLEGKLLLTLIVPRLLTREEGWGMGFLFGAFGNALLYFLFTTTKIPLTLLTVFGGHLLIIAVMLVRSFLTSNSPPEAKPQDGQRAERFSLALPKHLHKILIAFLLLSLSIKLFSAFGNGFLLPTYYYDELSQWNLRSRISYEDRAIAFDRDDTRGMSKPQYPILTHALQITFVLAQGEWLAGHSSSRSGGWSDHIARGSTLLLTLSFLASFALLLFRCGGAFFSLLGISLLLMVPLLTLQLGSSHADIHIIAYMLLSAVFLWMFATCHTEEGVSPSRSAVPLRGTMLRPSRSLLGQVQHDTEMPLLLLSGILVAVSSWAKLEGLFFGVLPWLFVVGLYFFLKKPPKRANILLAYLPTCLLAFSWPLFLLSRGLPVSPHGGGALVFGVKPFTEMLRILTTTGSYGVFLFVIPVVLIALIMDGGEAKPQEASGRRGLASGGQRKTIPLPILLILLWSIATLAATFFIFLFTTNVQYLLNEQTIHRTMLIPLTLSLLGALLLLLESRQPSASAS